MTQRQEEALRIKESYRMAVVALRRVGTLLRTTYAGEFSWAASQKIAVSGLCACIENLVWNVPDYKEDDEIKSRDAAGGLKRG